MSETYSDIGKFASQESYLSIFGNFSKSLLYTKFIHTSTKFLFALARARLSVLEKNYVTSKVQVWKSVIRVVLN